MLLDKNNGGRSTRSLIRRASIVKFSLHPEAYAESFRRKRRTRGGSRTALETIVDDASSVNTYGTSGKQRLDQVETVSYVEMIIIL